MQWMDGTTLNDDSGRPLVRSILPSVARALNFAVCR
ncbi:hypothetical protein PSEUDO9AZ_11396 [Pseudomonas sp. 9AZ]|nr:hypothetical protein PSEUDO9AZ_11396 [Pseudomonas sp. 9AZ]